MSREFIERWERAVSAKDFANLDALLAPDFVLISPVAHKPYTERPLQMAIFRAILHVLPDLSYSRREPLPSGALMLFSGTVDGLTLDGLDLFDLDASGRASRLTVMVRPLKAATVFAEHMARTLGAGR